MEVCGAACEEKVNIQGGFKWDVTPLPDTKAKACQGIQCHHPRVNSKLPTLRKLCEETICHIS